MKQINVRNLLKNIGQVTLCATLLSVFCAGLLGLLVEREIIPFSALRLLATMIPAVACIFAEAFLLRTVWQGRLYMTLGSVIGYCILTVFLRMICFPANELELGMNLVLLITQAVGVAFLGGKRKYK